MPKDDYFAGGSVKTDLKVPASLEASAASSGVDITAYEGECMVLTNILNTNGTTPTCNITLQTSAQADLVNTTNFSGNGTGTLTEVEGGPDAVAEDITITFSNATNAVVAGGTSGALGNATVAVKFSSAPIKFMLTAGDTPFEADDVFTVGTLAREYTDVVSLDSVGSIGSIQRSTVNTDELGEYLRANIVLSGANAAYTVGAAIFGLQNG